MVDYVCDLTEKKSCICDENQLLECLLFMFSLLLKVRNGSAFDSFTCCPTEIEVAVKLAIAPTHSICKGIKPANMLNP